MDELDESEPQFSGDDIDALVACAADGGVGAFVVDLRTVFMSTAPLPNAELRAWIGAGRHVDSKAAPRPELLDVERNLDRLVRRSGT